MDGQLTVVAARMHVLGQTEHVQLSATATTQEQRCVCTLRWSGAAVCRRRGRWRLEARGVGDRALPAMEARTVGLAALTGVGRPCSTAGDTVARKGSCMNSKLVGKEMQKLCADRQRTCEKGSDLNPSSRT
eukprot:6185605-Pleurochrysis_carterae.AAC.2